MPAIFPDLLPGELLYSAIARYSDMLGYRNSIALLRDIVGGVGSAITSPVLPGNLARFRERLPPSFPFTLSRLIESHTAWPYYRPFCSQVAGRRVENAMHSPSGSPATLVKTGRGVVQRCPWLRFCAGCVAQNREQFGTPYWHRVHQLSGVLVCPFHSLTLRRTSVPLVRARHGTTTVTCPAWGSGGWYSSSRHETGAAPTGGAPSGHRRSSRPQGRLRSRSPSGPSARCGSLWRRSG